MYCEYRPNWGDWVILVFMGFLQDVNNMYKDTVGVAELERKVSQQIRAKSAKVVYYLKRTWRVTQMILGVVN